LYNSNLSQEISAGHRSLFAFDDPSFKPWSTSCKEDGIALEYTTLERFDNGKCCYAINPIYIYISNAME
jgi:hypothetical protein